MNQKKLVDRINLAATLISSSANSGSGNYIISSKWVIDTILGGKRIIRMTKIEKILGKSDV